MLGPPLPHEIIRDTATALVLSNGVRTQSDNSFCGDDTAADCSLGSYPQSVSS
mgnify:CR=1 FL=1